MKLEGRSVGVPCVRYEVSIHRPEEVALVEKLVSAVGVLEANMAMNSSTQGEHL